MNWLKWLLFGRKQQQEKIQQQKFAEVNFLVDIAFQLEQQQSALWEQTKEIDNLKNKVTARLKHIRGESALWQKQYFN